MRSGDLVLDVATGTGLVARAIRERAQCHVIGVDLTPGMLAAGRSDGMRLVLARAEQLPFPDGRFDRLTFTYLLRYVDDPAATLRELARVVRPGGRIASLEFHRPRRAHLRLGWWLYTRLALPVLGRLVSPDWSRVGAFLGRSIDAFYDRYPLEAQEAMWSAAGLEHVGSEVLGLGAAVVTSGTKGRAGERPDAPPARPADAHAPAFYALRAGGWRDYITLLHPPYTAWHLSYVALGAALAPSLQLDRLAGTLLAFFLALGIGVHALDELNGRPLRTRIPRTVLRALGVLGLAAAAALGIGATQIVGGGLMVFVAIGLVLALAYPLELARGRLHGDLWFAIGWGAFPLVVSYWVQAGDIGAAAAAGAAYAIALSYAQRRLSTWVRALRRRVAQVSGEMTDADGTRRALDRATLMAAPESALRWLAAASVFVALAALAARLA